MPCTGEHFLRSFAHIPLHVGRPCLRAGQFTLMYYLHLCSEEMHINCRFAQQQTFQNL